MKASDTTALYMRVVLFHEKFITAQVAARDKNAATFCWASMKVNKKEEEREKRRRRRRKRRSLSK